MKIKMSREQRYEFFNELAISLNKTNLQEVKQIYFDFARFIIKRSKTKGFVNLPDVGMILVKEFKQRLGVIPTTKIRKLHPSCNTIKFLADYKFKKYVNDKGSRS